MLHNSLKKNTDIRVHIVSRSLSHSIEHVKKLLTTIQNKIQSPHSNSKYGKRATKLCILLSDRIASLTMPYTDTFYNHQRNLKFSLYNEVTKSRVIDSSKEALRIVFQPGIKFH